MTKERNSVESYCELAGLLFDFMCVSVGCFTFGWTVPKPRQLILTAICRVTKPLTYQDGEKRDGLSILFAYAGR